MGQIGKKQMSQPGPQHETVPLWYNLACAALFIGLPLSVVAGLSYLGGVPAHDFESTGTGTVQMPEQAAGMFKYHLWALIGLGLTMFGLLGIGLRLLLKRFRRC
ncbi:MAG: hypothetical protein GY851_18625 [bacterium]|nr:hypothetical protein [bacterium]